ncbi:MAG: Y-family DNA polymerase [Devosia sp.]
MPLFRGGRRYLMLHLPRWATDCLKRAEPALAQSDKPLVLWEKQRGAMRVAALDQRATAEGLSVGQSLSDARALVPNLDAREIDRAFTEQVFADFADWHSNASPIVSVVTDHAPYGDLCLDITGVSHLFSGERAMLAQLSSRLESLGYAVDGAIASTIGAAWALAHFAPGQVLAEGEEGRALSHMPVSALRLEAAQIDGLIQLGLKRIGQLYERDRSSMQARLGASFLLRLDQALGWAEEKLTPRLPLAEHFAEHRFADPIGLMDDVLMCTHDLAVQLSLRLERQGIGAQAFHLFLYRVDHKVMTLSVNAARATRDARHISRLFAYRAERLGGEYDAGFGIDMIRLAASSVSPLEATQVGAFGIDDGAATLDHLYDRMASRLGPLAVVQSRPVNTHIPERAVKLVPALVAAAEPVVTAPPVRAPRPLRLLPQPEPINVIAEVPDAPPASMVWRRVTYRFVKASGPERIAAEWRNAGQALKLTADTAETAKAAEAPDDYYEEGELSRDYYVAEDDGGRRFWLFRLGLLGIAREPRWYMHGFFA